jgi:hypothetical protein
MDVTDVVVKFCQEVDSCSWSELSEMQATMLRSALDSWAGWKRWADLMSMKQEAMDAFHPERSHQHGATDHGPGVGLGEYPHDDAQTGSDSRDQ